MEFGNAAGVQEAMPRRLRHSHATRLLRRKVDIHKVQRLLGHSNIATTTIYLHMTDDDPRDAIDEAFD